MKRNSVEAKDRGFTLIEILVAVAIMGIALVTIVGLQIKTIGLQQVADRTSVATFLAQEKLTETMIEISKNDSPSIYFDEGDFEESYSSYHWEYTLSTTPADSLYRVDFMVSWDPENKESNSVTLITFVAVKKS